MEADVPTDKKTRKRTEDTAADQAKHGDICSAKRVDIDPTSSTSFGMTAEPSAVPHRDDILVDKSTAAPKPCLSPVEMRKLTTAGDLLPAGTASTARRTIFPRQTRKVTAGQTTSLPHPAGNQCKRWCSILVVQQIVYAPARLWEGSVRCFMGWCSSGRRMIPEVAAFWFGRRMIWNIIFRETYKRFIGQYVFRLIVVPSRSQVDTGSLQSPTALCKLWG